ncbi:hypothetical protein FKM82_021613 [Ascaphus truei]
MAFNSTEATVLNNTGNEGSGFDENAYIHFTIAASVAIGLCLFGMVGNVIVFWYLCFRIQRNKYTVYIINLTVANVIFLVFSAILMMVTINSMMNINPDFPEKDKLYMFIEIFYDCTQYSGMFFLTAISIEWCLSVPFPIWYQCQRPKHLSSTVCIFLWILGCLESLIENLVCSPEAFSAQSKECTGVEIMTFIIGICVCLPLMILSSITLLIRIHKNVKQQYPPKLYIIIIAAVFVFILSVIPFNFLWFLFYFKLLPSDLQIVSLFYASVFCTVLNASVNPYIYFIVGRKRKEKSKGSIHAVLHRAFKVEEEEKEKSNRDETFSTS